MAIWFLHNSADCFYPGSHYVTEDKADETDTKVNSLLIARILLSQTYSEAFLDDDGNIDEFVYRLEYEGGK